MPSLPGHAPGAPFLGDTRLRGIRQLAPAECEALEFEGPLALARREYRFFIGPWRPSKYYVVSHRQQGEVLVCSRRELERLGITPED